MRADTVRVMPFAESNRDAYMAASEAVLGDVERMVAVWDGQPSGGRGGTADVVVAARARHPRGRRVAARHLPRMTPRPTALCARSRAQSQPRCLKIRCSTTPSSSINSIAIG